jgi:hypothetical protein
VSVKLFMIFYLILYLICLCRVHGCQGDFWRLNPHTNKWEGNPVFGSDYRVYYDNVVVMYPRMYGCDWTGLGVGLRAWMCQDHSIRLDDNLKHVFIKYSSSHTFVIVSRPLYPKFTCLASVSLILSIWLPR